MHDQPTIGIIGGMGPYAGLDLARKIFDETDASTDQDHLPVAILSYPGRIPDRSEFLFGRSNADPTPALIEIASSLETAGASVVGIPCNTAHADAIFGKLVRHFEDSGSSMRFLHIIEEAVAHIRREYDGIRRIGVLSTLATFRLRLYGNVIEAARLAYIEPDEEIKENVINRLIFQPPYGIKAQSNPVSPEAREGLLRAIRHLKANGAEAVVLGCTELPLAVTEDEIEGVPIVDPTRVLARALIRASYPDRLRDRALYSSR